VEAEPTPTGGVVVEKTIKVSPETHARLVGLGKKGETFDEIIKRLIKEAEEGIKNERN